MSESRGVFNTCAGAMDGARHTGKILLEDTFKIRKDAKKCVFNTTLWR
jgi:hypothetical protein